MSNGIKNKAKYLLYKRLEDRFSSALPAEIKEEKYYFLAQNLDWGNIPPELAFEIVKRGESLISGRVTTVLPFPEVPRKVFKLTGILGELFFNKSEVIIYPDSLKNREICVIYRENTRRSWNIYSMDRSSACCLIIDEEEDLPYDIRKWDDLWPGLYKKYLDSKFKGIPPTNGSDLFRSKRFLTTGLNALTHIRRINSNPSKAQLKKVSQESSLKGKYGKLEWGNISPIAINMDTGMQSEPDPYIDHEDEDYEDDDYVADDIDSEQE